MNGTNRKGDFFTEGRGRGFDIPERKELPATNAERTKAIEIDLGSLDQPGKGPVNFHMQRGRMVPSFSKNKPEGQPEDPLA